jgi:hypothetical protein
MIFSKSDFSTVLIVGANKGETKSLRVKTKHINRLKHYALTIGITIFILTCTIIFLSLELSKIEKERIAYHTEKSHI